MSTIETTQGPLAASSLSRSVGVEDHPEHLALWIEWRLAGVLVRRDAFPLQAIERGPLVYTSQGEVPISELVRTIAITETDNEYALAIMWQRNGELVRRDAHVVMKEPSVIADAIAAAIA